MNVTLGAGSPVATQVPKTDWSKTRCVNRVYAWERERCLCMGDRERKTDRQIDTDRQTDRQTDGIMVDPSHSFHIADYCIFGITLALSIAIGIYYSLSGGRQRTTDEYLLGGRVMRSIPLAISLLVSYDSSTFTLGVPAEMYVFGVQMWWSSFGFFAAIMFAFLVMVPLLYPLKITSAYEVST